MEGNMPSALRDRIIYETQLYEGFLDGLVKKIGDIPTNIQKTFTAAADVLKFIYNVIADKTGQNLKNAIAILQRNIKAVMSRIARVAANVPEAVKEVFDKVLEWLKTKMSKYITVQSDVDDQDNLKGDMSNWKKFISLFLGGCMVIFISKIGDIAKDFGTDVAKDGLTSILKMSSDALNKLIAEPQVALQAVGGAAIAGILLPLFKMYQSAKMLQTVNAELVNSNAWLKK